LLVNPVGAGLAASEARPGGNVTGILFAPQGFATKMVELAAELVPSAPAIGLLSNPGNPASVSAPRDVENAHLSSSTRIIVTDVKSSQCG
jgi:putative ABC transport system substrate-binding protein